MFQRDGEPSLSDGAMGNFHKLFLKDCVRFGGKVSHSMNQKCFLKWLRDSIPKTCAHVNEGKWVLLSFDGCRAYMTYYAVEMLQNKKRFVIALPAHTEDQPQPLDISVFGSMKTYAQNAIRDITLR